MADATQDAAIQVAEMLHQSHINRAPSPTHDNAPETSFDTKQTVNLDPTSSPPMSDVEDAEDDEIPLSVLRPTPRRAQMPPLPDMRLEQTYLASIKDTTSWYGVAYVTIRDQVLMTFVQGMAWTLIVAGWRHWNRASAFQGATVGSRIRRWWWGVNNWSVPEKKKA